MAYKIFIDGREGTTGLVIEQRLEAYGEIELLQIPPQDRKNKEARLELIRQSDLTFLCLPDVAAKEIMAEAPKESRIVDTSTAHRTHEDWTYGFPELNGDQRKKIQKATRVSVPGCHASGFIALVSPLTGVGVAPKDYPFTCHSVTGYSGGGKQMISLYEEKPKVSQGSFKNKESKQMENLDGKQNFNKKLDSDKNKETLNSPRQYALAQTHKHLKEMTAIASLDFEPVFNPIVSDFYRGMMVSVPLHLPLLRGNPSAEELRKLLADHYKGEAIISVMEQEQLESETFLNADRLREMDTMEIYVFGNNQRATLVALYDNLGKGASGAAIQCMNLMLGFPETKGLSLG